MNRNDGSRLYRYEPENGRPMRVSEDVVGCYDLWNDTIYYENVSGRTLCRMRLDGTEKEEITVPGHREGWVSLFQLSICPFRGKVYLACTTGLGNSLLLFAEDGSAECWITEELGSEINPYDRMFLNGEEAGQESYEAFEVTEEFVFVKLFWSPHAIKVYERATGRFVEEIDCRAGGFGSRIQESPENENDLTKRRSYAML